MNYGQVRDFTLKLLRQYSIAGDLVPPSYNDQADYLYQIIPLVNDAMTEIATTTRKIPAVLDLTGLEPEEHGDMLRYQLPEDFYQMRTGALVCMDHGEYRHSNQYRLQGKDYLLIPKSEAGVFEAEYFRYPVLLSSDASEDTELDNDQVTHMAIPYYVAAHMVSYEDAFQYSVFYNKYEDKLSKMSAGLEVEVSQVNDVYGDVFTGGDY